jgi:TolA-binding protein
MSSEPSPREWIAPKPDAARVDRQWAAIERRTRSPWSRLVGDVVPGAPLYTRPGFFALACLALVSLGILGVLGRGAFRGARAVASASAPGALLLADGSSIALDRDAEVSTPTNEPTHVVAVLARGGAHFEVVPNRQRSFTVVARGVEVRVVGTAFRVSTDASSGRTTVTVDHGIVEVRAPSLHGEVKRLGAGETWTSELVDAVASSAAVVTPPTGDGASSADPSASAVVDASTAAPSASAAQGEAPVDTGSSSASPSGGDDARALYESANKARRGGDLSRAAALYRDFLRKHPDDPRAQVAALELARLESETGGDPKVTEKALETASSATPGSAMHEDALARLVDVYAKKGDVAACKKARAQYLAAYPDGVHAATVRSRCATP